MGVIHKLRQEVTEFIVTAKKNTPTISCRQLSIMASEKFQKKISKSSVNTVLKSAKLSSSVGRRKGFSDKSFQIPEFKKKQIIQSLKEVGFVNSDKKEKVKKETDVAKKDLELSEKKEQERVNPSLEKKENEEEMNVLSENSSPPLEPLPSVDRAAILAKDIRITPEERAFREKEDLWETNFFKEAEEKRKEAVDGFSKNIDGMGLVFFKAIEWETSGKSFFWEFFEQYFSSTLDPSFEDACRSLVLFRYFNSRTQQDIEKLKDHALCFFDRVEDTAKGTELLSWADNNCVSEEQLVEYDLYKKYVFFEISYFKLFLCDGTTLTCDSQLRTFYSKDQGFKVFSPFYKSIRNLSRSVISNNDTIVSCFYSKDKDEVEQLYGLISCFEQEDKKKIKKICAFDRDKELLASYSVVPEIKRFFILGLYNTSAAMGVVSEREDISLRSPYFSKTADKIVYYSETIREIKVNEEFGLLRVIFLANNKIDVARFILVTNKTEEKLEDILESFLKKFPDYEEIVLDHDDLSFSWEKSHVVEPAVSLLNKETRGFSVEQTKEGPVSPFSGLTFLMDDYFSTVLSFCKNLYFPVKMFEDNINNLFTMLCGIKGRVRRDSDSLVIKLDLSEHQMHKDLFIFASKQLNNRNVVDPFGYKIRIEILK